MRSHHLKVDGVSFSFPNRRVLTDITFTVPAGRITGLIGENGAGKSTLLGLITGRRGDHCPADHRVHRPGDGAAVH